MENTPNKITTKILEKILELNVKLKAYNLNKFSFEVNSMVISPSLSNPQTLIQR